MIGARSDELKFARIELAMIDRHVCGFAFCYPPPHWLAQTFLSRPAIANRALDQDRSARGGFAAQT